MAYTALDIRPRSRDNKVSNDDDSEVLIMMRNVSSSFRYVRQLASMLLSLIADAVCYLGLLSVPNTCNR